MDRAMITVVVSIICVLTFYWGYFIGYSHGKIDEEHHNGKIFSKTDKDGKA